MIISVDGGMLGLGGEMAPGGLKNILMRHLIDEGRRSGRLPQGATVADVSTGSSAVALARVAREYGLHARVHVPPTLSTALMSELHEAEAEVVTDTLPGALAALQAGHRAGSLYWTRQNFDAAEHGAYVPLVHSMLASGLLHDGVDAVVAGVGSGSTLAALGEVLRQHYPGLKVIGVYSRNVAGLRPSVLSMNGEDRQDQGTRARLTQAFGRSFIPVTVDAGDLARARAHMAECHIEGTESTAAVLHIMRLMGGRVLGVSMDGRHAFRPAADPLGPQPARSLRSNLSRTLEGSSAMVV